MTEENKTIHIHDNAHFQAEALGEDAGVVLVDFYADRCGPCKVLVPVMEEIAAEYDGRVKVLKVDVDAVPEPAGEYGVVSIPTIYIFNNGKAGEPIVWAMPKEAYTDIIDDLLD